MVTLLALACSGGVDAVGQVDAAVSKALPALTTDQRTRLIARLGEIIDRKDPVWQSTDYADGNGTLIQIDYAAVKVLSKVDKPNCVGATFSAFCDAYQTAIGRKDGAWIPGVDLARFKAAQRKWYVTEPAKSREGCAGALVDLGLAKKIEKLEDLQPNDFLQIWWKTSENAGHSVIVTDVDKDKDGKVTAVTFWSANTTRAEKKDKDGKVIQAAMPAGFGRRTTKPGEAWRPTKDGKGFEFYAVRLTASN